MPVILAFHVVLDRSRRSIGSSEQEISECRPVSLLRDWRSRPNHPGSALPVYTAQVTGSAPPFTANLCSCCYGRALTGSPPLPADLTAGTAVFYPEVDALFWLFHLSLIMDWRSPQSTTLSRDRQCLWAGGYILDHILETLPDGAAGRSSGKSRRPPLPQERQMLLFPVLLIPSGTGVSFGDLMPSASPPGWRLL